MLLKSPSVQIIDRMVHVRYSVRIDAQVMKRNFCNSVAPSTAAASYSSSGMASRPEIRISVQNGSDFQMWTVIPSDRASVGLFSQFGPSSGVMRKITELIGPHSGFSMNRNDSSVGIDGTAQGRMNSTDSALIQRRFCTKKPDSKRAMTILMLMPTTRKTSVFTTERANTGSSNR